MEEGFGKWIWRLLERGKLLVVDDDILQLCLRSICTSLTQFQFN